MEPDVSRPDCLQTLEKKERVFAELESLIKERAGYDPVLLECLLRLHEVDLQFMREARFYVGECRKVTEEWLQMEDKKNSLQKELNRRDRIRSN